MAAEIVLLTGEVEGPILAGRLQGHDPALAVVHVQTLDALEAAAGAPGRQQRRLIAFCSALIVPDTVLAALPGPAYNFHPAPPTYPGSHAAAFALYDGATLFGATAHVMEKRVDEGAIVATDLFDVPGDCDHDRLEILSYQAVIRLFDRLAPRLVDLSRPLDEISVPWSGRKTTNADFNAMMSGWEALDETERARRRRAFGEPLVAGTNGPC